MVLNFIDFYVISKIPLSLSLVYCELTLLGYSNISELEYLFSLGFIV